MFLQPLGAASQVVEDLPTRLYLRTQRTAGELVAAIQTASSLDILGSTILPGTLVPVEISEPSLTLL